MITHDNAQALISARYDQLLAPAETRELQEHLAGCATCRRFAAETDYLVTGLRALPHLAPSPRVSRAVREGIRGSGATPWGWLGQALRVAASPTLAVASSLVLVAALAFIIVLALRPLGLDEEPRATISAVANVIETATAEPERTPFAAPTAVPTQPAVAAPTQEPTPVPTARQTSVTPPTSTPVPPTQTPVPTPRSILTREQATEPPVVETPAPTEAPPPVATQPPVEDAAATRMIEAANEAVVAPTSPPIAQSSEGAPFMDDDPVATEESQAAPVYEQPPIVQGGPGQVADLEVATGAPTETADVAIMAESDPAATDADATSEAPAAAEPTAEPTPAPAAPTSTPVEIIAAAAPPDEREPGFVPDSGEPPQLPVRDGNEAIDMDGDSMVAAIQATVQAGLNDDSGPPAVPTSADPPPSSAAQATGTGEGAAIGPVGVEITGAPASEPLVTEIQPTATLVPEVNETAPIVGDAAPAAVDPATGSALEQAPTVVPQEQVPVAPPAIGAPEPAWPGIGGAGTQYLSNAGYSAIFDGGAVTVYASDGTPLGVVGGGVPSWSPAGSSLLVIGPDGLGAVWDANVGLIPVERSAAPARDIPVGWYGGEPLVQRVYLDGSGRVELRVVPVTGAAGYAIGTATADSVFGEGVTSARLSPEGGEISFVSGGQLYIAPVSEPAAASPAG